MRANRAPTQIWATRRDLSGGYVKTDADDLIVICAPGNGDGTCDGIIVSRAEARLLAKRINECLDATVLR